MIRLNRKVLLTSVTTGLAIISLSGCGFFGGGSSGSEDAKTESADTAQEAGNTQASETAEVTQATEIAGLESAGEVKIDDSEYFTIGSYKDGYYVIDTNRGNTSQRLLVVPDGKEVPEGTGKDVIIVKQPVGNCRVDSNSLIALMEKIQPDLVDKVSIVAGQRENMKLESVAKNMDSGSTVYGGSAKNPDVELTKSKDPGVYIALPELVSQEAYSKLKESGIDPFVSFYHVEEEPFGRLEWVKVLGAIFGNMEAAEAFYNGQKEIAAAVDVSKAEGKSYIMFCLNKEKNKAYVRRKDDVIAKTGDMAGGKNMMEGTKNMGWEEMTIDDFAGKFKDADCLVYMSDHGDPLETLADLTGVSDKLGDFKAVKEKNVWKTKKDYLLINEYGEMIRDMNNILAGGSDAGETATFVHMD